MGNIETENALTEPTAQRALEKACQQTGLDADDAELIRIGSNAAYRLREPVIVRIARDPNATEGARKQVAVARDGWSHAGTRQRGRSMSSSRSKLMDARDLLGVGVRA